MVFILASSLPFLFSLLKFLVRPADEFKVSQTNSILLQCKCNFFKKLVLVHSRICCGFWIVCYPPLADPECELHILWMIDCCKTFDTLPHGIIYVELVYYSILFFIYYTMLYPISAMSRFSKIYPRPLNATPRIARY